MLKITKILSSFESCCDFLEYDPKRSLFFDIETTGLSAASSMVLLIGTIHQEGERWILTQLLAQNANDEPAILEAFFQLAEQYEMLIHFNGTAFDLPFLKERAIHHNLLHPLSDLASLDLYQKFRPLKKRLNLPRMNQTTLEDFLDYHREDKLTGKHMISLFKKYVASGEKLVADLFLLHNHDDLAGMTQLLKLSSYLMLFQGEIKSVSMQLSFAKPDDCTQNTPNEHQLKWCGNFTLKQPLPRPFTETVLLEDNLPVTLSVQESHGQLTAPIIHEELKYFFPDYRNYFYLPCEDQAIHKSVGAYVDKEHRENAKPANCYTRKTGIFLPQPEVIFEPAFKREYASKELFFEYEKLANSTKEELADYVKLLLCHLGNSDFISKEGEK